MLGSPDVSHGVQSITFEPHDPSISEIVGIHSEAALVSPVVIGDPLVHPVIPVSCSTGMCCGIALKYYDRLETASSP